ncbi:MAG: right-handed parallel beta-helix repeat-containing protein, partial [Bacteroidota bacterium]
MIYIKKATTLFVIIFFSVISTHASVFQVGASKQYKNPSEVMSKVADGDTVEIDAGVYSKDVGRWTKNNLLIRGVGGKAHLKADGANSGGKAIWVITGNNTTVENIEFSGASVPDKNGAGIRQEGEGLTVRRCFFHDNEDGILCGANQNSDMLIEFSEFARNGYGDGYSHNLYIGNIRNLTFR